MTIPPAPEHETAPTSPPVDPGVPRRPAAPVSWWRANRLALIALAVLIPLVGIGVGWTEWFAYYGYGARKVHAVVVADDATTDLAGATWGPIRGGQLQSQEGMDVPEHAKVLAAVIPVEPHGKAVQCSPPVLVQQSTGREWTPMRAEVGIGYDSSEPDRCVAALADPEDPESAEPYSLVVAFVVPDDADGPFWVEVSPSGDDRFVRFSLDP